jgi:hypothetical protein
MFIIDDDFREDFEERIKERNTEEVTQAIEIFCDGLRLNGQDHIIAERFGVLQGVVGLEPHADEEKWLGNDYSEDDKKKIAWSLIVDDINGGTISIGGVNKTPWLNNYTIRD